MLKKLNEYFICDPDEQPSTTDYIFYYGISVLVLIIAVFFLIAFGRS